MQMYQHFEHRITHLETPVPHYETAWKKTHSKQTLQKWPAHAAEISGPLTVYALVTIVWLRLL